jgi:UDP-3-O-[3-hydroxymyristoyl] glucosamine N-acyltransferase
MKARDIAELVGGELIGDGEVEIHSVWDIKSASNGQLAFIDDGEIPASTRASCVIAGHDNDVDVSVPVIRVKNPKLAFARAAAVLHKAEDGPVEIHPSAVIAATAILAADVSIGAHCSVGAETAVGSGTRIRDGVIIGRDVILGRSCTIHPNVFIENGVSIGDNVIIHGGSVIGADGFGYVRDQAGEYHKFPQIGRVVIENNVEIGANSCVDRGALGETRIGEGTKIDNLVQIGHNVQIGKRVVIAAQTGISGSTVIEDDCVIGGQVGMGDHAIVKSGAVIGSQAGVLPGKIVRAGVWWGTPVQPLDEYKRQNAMVKGLARLREEVKELKKKSSD